nr:Amuc_1099 family pilus-like system protein [Chthoniobacter flavus]
MDDPKVPLQDPDQDGFTNEDEWREHTDPKNKESHPAYHTKLFLERVEEVAFRFVFMAYGGDPAKDRPERMRFQIDKLDLRQPSDFLALGDMIPNTKYKLDKFVQKFAPNPLGKDDISELTVVDTVTGQKVLLILNKIANDPDVYARFAYEWLPLGSSSGVQRFRVKVSQEFVLKPLIDDRHHYKLLDVDDKEARIGLPTGEMYTVKPDPRRSAEK